jgi:hypothetical protein
MKPSKEQRRQRRKAKQERVPQVESVAGVKPLTDAQVRHAGLIVDRMVRDACASEGKPLAQACMLYVRVGLMTLHFLYGAKFSITAGGLELAIAGSPNESIGFMPRLAPTVDAALDAGAWHAWLARDLGDGRAELVDFTSRNWHHAFTAAGESPTHAIPDIVHTIASKKADYYSQAMATQGFVHAGTAEVTRFVNSWTKTAMQDKDVLEENIGRIRYYDQAIRNGMDLVTISDVVDVPMVDLSGMSLGELTEVA